MKQNLSDVAENWYARLNNLKAYIQREDISTAKREQCLNLISVMILRMTKIIPLYVEARSKQYSKPTGFPIGGVTFK